MDLIKRWLCRDIIERYETEIARLNCALIVAEQVELRLLDRLENAEDLIYWKGKAKLGN